MNRQDLYEGMDHIDNDILERSERARGRHSGHGPRWMGAVAAVLAVAIVGGALLRSGGWLGAGPAGPNTDGDGPAGPGGLPVLPVAYAIEMASYPEMAPYPNEQEFFDPVTGEFRDEEFSAVYHAWEDSVEAQRQEKGYADGLEPFFSATIRQFLSDSEGENRACSPLNLYLALGMLAELTDGESRQQILDLIGVDSVETLRTQAKSVWNAHYRRDGATTSVLASSLWLNEDMTFVPSTMEILAENYYASSYQGKMGSPEFDKALQDWLNQQTGGLLGDQVEEIGMEEDTALALATTVYFQAKWADEFSEEDTAPQVFHAPDGDVTCDFLHGSGQGDYYWGDGFTATGRRLENGGGTMWFLLPDQGTTVEELLENPQTTRFLLADGEWANQKRTQINLSLPKFDIISQTDLQEGLEELGVRDVFDYDRSDFSPMTTGVEELALSKAQHDVRVAIDEEGVTAAAYTVMMVDAEAAPMLDEVDFVLDRPFLFAVTSEDGLPLFVGSVYQPG